MNSQRAFRTFRLASSLGILALAVAASAACDEPKVRCTATGGEAMAKYRVKGDVPDACKGTGFPGTDAGDITKNPIDPARFPIGVESYVPNPSDDNAYQKVNSIALQPEWIGARIADARDNAGLTYYPYKDQKDNDAHVPPPTGAPSTEFPYVYGSFTTVNPDSNNICTVAAMTVSDFTYPDVPKHQAPDPNDDTGQAQITVDDQPQTHIHHEWKNVRVVVSPASLGTQTFGEMTVTQDDCTLTYDVSILYPKVGCAKLGPDGKTPTGDGDETLCDPSPTPENPFGSGISEGIPTTCENVSLDKANPDWECMPKYMCAGAADCAKYNVVP